MASKRSFAEEMTEKLSGGRFSHPTDLARAVLQQARATPLLVLTDAEIDAHVRTAARTAFVLGRGPTPTGRNWFGGLPLLPRTQPWPRTQTHLQPMHFWLQIDCATLTGNHALPRDGLLLFFYDLDDQGANTRDNGLGAVRYVPADEIPAQPHPAPADLPHLHHAPGVQHSAYSTESIMRIYAALPHGFDTYLMADADLDWDRIDWGCEAKAEAHADTLTHANRKETIAGKCPETYGQHALLGPEQAITNPTGGDGIRLACLGSDTEMGWEFGDVGVVEFWITPEDLRARRFDRAYAMTG